MLLDGVNHVAIVTNDTERFVAFYRDNFDAVASHEMPMPPGMRLTFVDIGPGREINLFEIDGNTEADRQVPMFGRGRIDHLALQAESFESFKEIRSRLMDCEATDGFVTDFGPILSVFFRDPDGLECEVCVDNPAAVPGTFNPPGTPSSLF